MHLGRVPSFCRSDVAFAQMKAVLVALSKCRHCELKTHAPRMLTSEQKHAAV